MSDKTVRAALHDRIGNTLVERYVADILGIDIDMPVATLRRRLLCGERVEYAAEMAAQLTPPTDSVSLRWLTQDITDSSVTP